MNFFLIKLNYKLKSKILSIDNISKQREEILIQTIILKEVKKRQRLSGENNFYLKNSKNS